MVLIELDVHLLAMGPGTLCIPFCMKPGSLLHPEPMLFINYHQAQSIESHVVVD